MRWKEPVGHGEWGMPQVPRKVGNGIGQGQCFAGESVDGLEPVTRGMSDVVDVQASCVGVYHSFGPVENRGIVKPSSCFRYLILPPYKPPAVPFLPPGELGSELEIESCEL